MTTKRWHTREDSGIRLDRQLRWFHDDELIEHPKIIEAFNQGLTPTGDGRFKLTFGNDWCFVTVEDCAYAITAVDVFPDGVRVRLSDRTGEPLDVSSLELGEEGVLTCRVKQGQARARFSRDAQFALGELLIEHEGGLALELGGQRHPIRNR